jgi:prevent-host-death family protein
MKAGARIMKQYSMHEAKAQLSSLVDQAVYGETIVIGKYGRPVAQIVPYREGGKADRIGFLAGQIKAPDDFDHAFDAEILEMFSGEK